MIMHPDGRIEGTPLEIIAYKKLTSPAPTDEEESDPERPTPEQLNERLAEAAHAAKTPIPSGKQEAVKNTFLKCTPWRIFPDNTKEDLHDLVHRSKACECRSYGYTSCPECKHKITFEA